MSANILACRQPVGLGLAPARGDRQHDVMQTITLEHVYLSVVDLDRTLAFYRRLFPDWIVRWEGSRPDGRWVHFGAAGDGQPGYLSLAEHPRAAAATEPYTTCLL